MGKKHFCFFETAETGNRTPNSGVKGSGANHYPRAPAPEAGTRILPGKYIVGDSAYPVKEYLVTPFKDNGHLRDNQRRFNRRVSSMRQVVERTIRHIECRFRRLQSIHLYKVKAVTKVVIAACILHNTCIVSGDDLDDFIQEDPDHNVNNYPHVYGNNVAGLAFRDQIAAARN